METDAPKCPRCAAGLKPPHIPLARWQCFGCNGVWLAADEFTPLLAEIGLGVEHLHEMAQRFGGEAMTCPACQRRMEGAQLKGAMVDVCHGCGGCWVDGGELATLTGGKQANPARMDVLPMAAAKQGRVLVSTMGLTPQRPALGAAMKVVGGGFLALWSAIVVSKGAFPMLLFPVAALAIMNYTKATVVVRAKSRTASVEWTFAGVRIWFKEVDASQGGMLAVRRKRYKNSRDMWVLRVETVSADLRLGIFDTPEEALERCQAIADALGLAKPTAAQDT